MSADLYADPEVCQAVLMDYFRNPRCAGTCDPATHTAEGHNPACGDVIKLSFEVKAGRILQARTTGAGCAVSQAAASLLMEQLQGKTLTDARRVLEELDALLTRSGGDPDMLDRLLALRMITGNPARVRCAQTAREAAASALA
jgi:nitrogen fixation NifU-like protein